MAWTKVSAATERHSQGLGTVAVRSIYLYTVLQYTVRSTVTSRHRTQELPNEESDMIDRRKPSGFVLLFMASNMN